MIAVKLELNPYLNALNCNWLCMESAVVCRSALITDSVMDFPKDCLTSNRDIIMTFCFLQIQWKLFSFIDIQ